MILANQTGAPLPTKTGRLRRTKMFNMTTTEARETIREIMNKWNETRALVIKAGASEADADEITGRILSRSI